MSDPRPVFQGDWGKATGKERQAHMTLVAAWKARQPGGDGDAQSRMAASSGRLATPVAMPVPTGTAGTAGDAATRSVLVAIRDNANAHDSDRIRAAQALIALDREAEQATGAGPSHLVALRQVLDTLEPHERLAWLQGERLGHLQEGGAA